MMAGANSAPSLAILASKAGIAAVGGGIGSFRSLEMKNPEVRAGADAGAAERCYSEAVGLHTDVRRARDEFINQEVGRFVEASIGMKL